jgi:hypothetical protein
MLETLVSLLFVLAPADSVPAEIPLSEIWGYGIGGPGPGSPKYLSGSPVEKALISVSEQERLTTRLKGPRHAGPAFVVRGANDRGAIKNVMSILDGHSQVKHSFPEDDNLYLIVLAYGLSGPGLQLDKVEFQNKRIVVTWHLTEKSGMGPGGGAHSQFAMIPLGRLKKGEYDVEMKRDTMKFDADWWVSKSTSFQVLPKEETPPRIPGFGPTLETQPNIPLGKP